MRDLPGDESADGDGSESTGSQPDGRVSPRSRNARRRAHKRETRTARRTTEPESEPAGEPTTMMLRGIPNRTTEKQLMAKLEDAGLGEAYDYLYLPRVSRLGKNLGYAFVNLPDPQHAQDLRAQLEDTPMCPNSQSLKRLAVEPAQQQGIYSHLQKMQRAHRGPCNTELYLRVAGEMVHVTVSDALQIMADGAA